MIIRVSNHADRIRLTAIEIWRALSETKAPFAFLSGHRWPDSGFFAQQRQHFFHKRLTCDAVFFAQDRNGAVLDELVRPTDAHNWRIDHLRMQMFHHRAAKPVIQNMIFDRADDLDAAGERSEE